MRTALATSLVFTLALAVALTPALTPVSASAAVPAGSFALQQPDNSQNAPQYPSQDNPPQQDNSPQGNPQDNSQPQGNSQGAGAGNYQAFSPDQLDNLLSPIALYPDPLLAQVFVAATFPDQVEEAARFVRGNGTSDVDNQNWDVSVRAVAHYPTVIEMMADKIDWTTSLGQAYVNQSTDVSTSVQRLRHQAKSVGNLPSNQQQEVLENDNYIAINPAQPQYIYVPVYDPAIIYYRQPYWGPAITFGYGYPIGGWLNLGFHWGYWGGGFGGIYYTGWNPYGWGRGCWNCGWIGRSRVYVNYHSNIYINNRYSNININRTVVNRTVNVNNISHYNYVHKNVNYNNVRTNNDRINRQPNNAYRPGNNNRPGENGGGVQRPGNNVRPGENGGGVQRPANTVRPGENGGGVQRTANGNDFRGGGGNRNLDSNIHDKSRVNDFRGHDIANNNRNDRPSNQPQQRPAQQQNRGQQAPHAFGTAEGHFNARESQQRGQASRQQAQRPQQQQRAPQQRSAPPSRGGGGGRKP
jgi:hypothetical protein